MWSGCGGGTCGEGGAYRGVGTCGRAVGAVLAVGVVRAMRQHVPVFSLDTFVYAHYRIVNLIKFSLVAIA